MSVTIYHNPDCGTSRNTLAMIRNAGIEPDIIEYLKTPPSRDTLVDLVNRMGVPLRTVLRRKGAPFDDLGLGDRSLPDAALLDAVARYPILLNRPIVVTPQGVRLCRPSEVVLDLIDRPQRTRFIKEDGQPVVIAHPVDAAGQASMAAALNEAGLLPTDPDGPDQFLYRFTDTLGETVGFGGLEGSGPDLLLRSLVILPEFRGRGFGGAAATTLERIAGGIGPARLHLLTIGAGPFFERLGYHAAARAEAPPAIAQTGEFAGLCPATARYFVKSSRQSW
jgi:arsenate reductase